MGLRPADSEARWRDAAIVFGTVVLGLLVADVFVWHPGFCLGDEADVVGWMQRVREGMPSPWLLGSGQGHRWLLRQAMGLWPGTLGVTALPGLLALGVEAALLYVLGRSLGGPRAGFFAVAAGLGAAFTLVRARAGLSFSLFPAEWLALVWLRTRCQRPWAWLLWGGLLGLCFFDYEAWIPAGLLLILVPFLGPLSARQRAWEAVGLTITLALLLPWDQVAEHWQRRRNASLFLASASSASAGWKGVLGLVQGAKSMPYMAPAGQGVLPWLYVLALPLGLKAWGPRAWVPLLSVVLGVALVLAGGAPYGVPAHRFIAAWPAVALVVGLGLAGLWTSLTQARSRYLLAVALVAGTGLQLFAWSGAQAASDAAFRAPVRDLKRAADAAWMHSQAEQLPLVTETHPLKGPLFRYMTGHRLPLPPEKAAKIVAFLPWEYLPAVRGVRAAVATFQEQGGYPAGMVAELQGREAAAAVEAERHLRPVLNAAPLISLKSIELVHAWLAQHPGAGAWARTVALDYVGFAQWMNGRYSPKDIEALRKEKLVSARPLLIAALGTAESMPEFSLQTLRYAKQVDAYNGRAWVLEAEVLDRLGRVHEAEAQRVRYQALYDKGALLCE